MNTSTSIVKMGESVSRTTAMFNADEKGEGGN